jgi:hypothetical protein
MTSSKRIIVQNLITWLQTIDGTQHIVPGCPFSPYTYINDLSRNVTDEFMFLENINDFPTVSFFQTTAEHRTVQGTGEVYGTASYLARCYFMSDGSNEQADDLIEDLQFAINSFKYTQNNSDLVDLKINAVSSDEHILDPYGIVEISLILVYRLTI